MLRFYLQLLQGIWRPFRKTAETLSFWGVSVILALGILLVPSLGGSLEGLSPWWSMSPLVVAFLFAILRANYNRFHALEVKLAGLEDRRDKQAILNHLSELHEEGNRLFGKVLTAREELAEWCAKVEAWRQDTTDYLRANYPPTIPRRFGNLVVVSNLRHEWAVDESHQRQLDVLREQLDALTLIIGTGIAG